MTTKNRPHGTIQATSTVKAIDIPNVSGTITLKNQIAGNTVFITLDNEDPVANASPVSAVGYPLESGEKLVIRQLPDRDYVHTVKMVTVGPGTSDVSFLFA